MSRPSPSLRLSYRPPDHRGRRQARARVPSKESAPWTGHGSNLADEEAKGNLTLASLIRDQRGNPALSAWEEGFLTDIERLLRSHDGRVTLTDKQFDRVFLIFEKLD